MSTIVTGDDPVIPVELEKDGATFIIDSGATVKASLISKDKKVVLIDPVNVLEANTGSDWANSLIIIKFTSTATNAISRIGNALLEIQVDDGGKLTWFVPIKVEKGTIDQ